MKKQIIKNILSNYFVNFLQMALGILVVPFLILKLGKEAFGLIVLVESTIAIFEIMVGSVRIALSRHATFALAQGDTEGFVKYLSTGKYILFVVGFFVLMSSFVMSYFFPQIFKVPGDLLIQSKILYLLVTLSFFITIPNIVYWSILYAKQRFDLLNTASSFGLISRALFIFLLFSVLPNTYHSLITYGFIYLFMKAAENTLIYIWHKKVMPGIHLTLKDFQGNKVKEILSFSGYMSLSSISSILYENTANILINIFYGPVFNAIYAVSLKIPMTINNIFLRSTWSLAPTITDLVAKNDNDRLQRLFFTYSKILCIVTLPVILFIMAMSRKIIDLWVGNSFLQASGLLSIHLIPLIIILPLTVVNLVPNAYAKVKIPSQVTLFVAVINVALGVTLAKYFGLKLYGFAISAAICTFINSGVFLPYYSCKISGLSIYRYILNAFLRPFLLGCLLIVPLFLIIRSFHFNSSLGMVFIQGVLAVLIYYSLSYLYLINKYEKGLIAGIINRRIL